MFRGRYLAGHLAVLTLAGLFILAGFWQLDRLHQVKSKNAVVRSRMASAPVPLARALPAGWPLTVKAVKPAARPCY